MCYSVGTVTSIFISYYGCRAAMGSFSLSKDAAGVWTENGVPVYLLHLYHTLLFLALPIPRALSIPLALHSMTYNHCLAPQTNAIIVQSILLYGP